MQLFTSALLLGSVAFQSVLGRPNLAKRDDLNDFVPWEVNIALQKLLCNIGPDGCEAKKAHAGVVIASPSTEDPNYFYTWTRDSALVFKSIVDRFTHEWDADLQKLIEDYVVATAQLQPVSNPSGNFEDGTGLGEPKFYANLTQFTGSWGRPQRDGPPLRAIAMISYANWLIDNGYKSTVQDLIWPVVRNDLSYVAQYWNQTGFDLWEEVNGTSFFTTASQHRALVEGSTLAGKLGQSGKVYSDIAPQVLCLLQQFWQPSEKYIKANINVNNGRAGKDANTLLASIHNFDAKLGCDSATFQPCSDKALANHKTTVDSFRIYNINKGIAKGKAIAVGRYSEDVYFSGNPWYLATLAAAEQLYDSLHVWRTQKSITVTDTSLEFFTDLVPSIKPGTYKKCSKEYRAIFGAVRTYAEGFVSVVEKYTPYDGALAEQFDRDDGYPISARDLTWSYASFLTCADRRAGIVPPPWLSNGNNKVPGQCSTSSVKGTYIKATGTQFPPNQTPSGGVPTHEPTTTATWTRPTPTESQPCRATAVDVTFKERVETKVGQTIKIVGNTDAIGNWDPQSAVPLDASDYTSANPIWKATIRFHAGQVFEYKYINVAEDGGVTWEADPNHTYTVAKSCATAATVSDTWQAK